MPQDTYNWTSHFSLLFGFEFIIPFLKPSQVLFFSQFQSLCFLLFSFICVIKNIDRFFLFFFGLSFLLSLTCRFFLYTAGSRYIKGFIFFIILNNFLNLVFIHFDLICDFIHICIFPIFNSAVWVLLFYFFLDFFLLNFNCLN